MTLTLLSLLSLKYFCVCYCVCKDTKKLFTVAKIHHDFSIFQYRRRKYSSVGTLPLSLQTPRHTASKAFVVRAVTVSVLIPCCPENQWERTHDHLSDILQCRSTIFRHNVSLGAHPKIYVLDAKSEPKYEKSWQREKLILTFTKSDYAM